MTTTEQQVERHGELDDDAAARLEDLLRLMKEGGQEATPGRVMSTAIRLFHMSVTGVILPADGLGRIGDGGGSVH